MLKLTIFVAIMALGVVYGLDCKTCLTNDAYCESEKSYYYCMNGEKLGDLMFCDDDTSCTNNADNICLKASAITAPTENVCKGAGTCGSCVTGKPYTCVSNNTAARCSAGNIVSYINCKADEICSTNAYDDYKSVCIPKCMADFLKLEPSCSNDDYTTPPPIPLPTPSPADQQDICDTKSTGVTTTWFYALVANAKCNTYVYCEKDNQNVWRPASVGTCSPPKPYFDLKFRDCVATKPTSCP